MRYRSKPDEVEALQWDAVPGVRDGLTPEDVVAWVNANGGEARYVGPSIAVRTVNGWAYAAPGHYVVTGQARFPAPGTEYVNGVPSDVLRDFYPCDPETFERRWEPIP